MIDAPCDACSVPTRCAVNGCELASCDGGLGFPPITPERLPMSHGSPEPTHLRRNSPAVESRAERLARETRIRSFAPVDVPLTEDRVRQIVREEFQRLVNF